MSEFDQGDLRIGDSEREAALTALGEHMSSGRLNIDEYGERSAKITAAKTRRELLVEFADLPEPKPRLDSAAPTATPTAAPSASQPPQSVATQENSDIERQWEQRPAAQRLTAALVPLSALVAVALFFLLHNWVVFLLPAAVTVIGGALWGEDWKHDRHEYRRAHHEYRRSRHDRRRGIG